MIDLCASRWLSGFRASSCYITDAPVLNTMTPHRTLPILLLSIAGTLPLQNVLWAQVPATPSGTEQEATSLKTRSQAAAVEPPVSGHSSSEVTPGNAIPAGRIL